MKAHKKYLRYFACLAIYAACFEGAAFPQTSKSQNLTRDDVVIRQDKPSIYICVDGELMKKSGRGTNELWLRINNNTIWTVRFKAGRMGTKPQLFKLPSGENIAALSNNSVAYPHYSIESKETGERLRLWGHTGTFNWLLSNNSAVFSVPAKYFKDNILSVEYVYEWEFIGVVGQESYAPQHRVYFAVYDAREISGNLCD